VTAQEVLYGLVEEKLQIQGTRIRQSHHKARQGAAGTPHQDRAEMRPVDLRLLTREELKTQKRLTVQRAQPGHRAPQLGDTAAVAAIVDHLINARGAQSRMLLQHLPDKFQVRIDEG